MEIKVNQEGASSVIELKGHLDAYTAKEADAVFKREAEAHDEVILDMAEVNYLSSAGIRVLRNLYMIMYRKGGSLRMVNPTETVTSVLEMTGLLDLLNLEKRA